LKKKSLLLNVEDNKWLIISKTLQQISLGEEAEEEEEVEEDTMDGMEVIILNISNTMDLHVIFTTPNITKNTILIPTLIMKASLSLNKKNNVGWIGWIRDKLILVQKRIL
jgi:hypothetical protein